MTPAASGMVAYAIPPSASSPPTMSSNERRPRRRSAFIANSPGSTENLRGGVSPIRPRSRPLAKSSLPGQSCEGTAVQTDAQIACSSMFLSRPVTPSRHRGCRKETTDDRAGGWMKCRGPSSARCCDQSCSVGSCGPSFSLMCSLHCLSESGHRRRDGGADHLQRDKHVFHPGGRLHGHG